MLHFRSKFPVNGPPGRGPYGGRHPFSVSSSTHSLITHFSLKVPGKVALLHFHPTGSPGRKAAPSQVPMVYTFIYICQSPQLRSPPTKWGKTNHHSTRSPLQTGGLHTMGCGLVPQGHRLRHCYHSPSAMQPSTRYIPPWLG